MKNYLGNQKLNKLPSRLMYANFDKGDIGCDNFYYYELVKQRLESVQLHNNSSNKILKGLCYVYKTSAPRNIDRDSCYYLYFWLGDVLDKNLTDRRFLYSVMDSLKFILNNDGTQRICDFNKYNMTQQNFMDIKNLFDLSKDYNELKKYFNSPINSCNDKFKINLDGYVMIYRRCHNNCNEQSGNHDDTCRFFNQYFSGKEKMDVLKWTCNSEENGDTLSTPQVYHGDVEKPSASGGVQRIGAQIQSKPEVEEELDKELEPQQQTEEQEKLLRTGSQEGHNMEVELRNTHKEAGGAHLKYENSEHINVYSTDPESSTTIGISDGPSAFSSPKSMVIAPLVIGITV
ncbi:variable surface protein, partial [Plasmodium gonderi]